MENNSRNDHNDFNDRYNDKNDLESQIENALKRLSAPAVFSRQQLFGNGNNQILEAIDEEQSFDADGDDDQDRNNRLRGNVSTAAIATLLRWVLASHTERRQ